jgi:hypothetical protein
MDIQMVSMPGIEIFDRVIVPITAFRGLSDKEVENITQKMAKDREKKKKERPNIYCATCRNLVTTSKAAVTIAGLHRHSFINPAGIHYEIACFSTAKGCFNMGDPTLEFTWFPGYTWCYSVCGKCFNHLGWFYQSGDSHFYGLILNRLVRDD